MVKVNLFLIKTLNKKEIIKIIREMEKGLIQQVISIIQDNG
jgi:hypothetical protein